MVTVIAQFTAKMTKSEKTIYFLSLMSCSINKLKSVFRFLREKKNFFAPGSGGDGGRKGGGVWRTPCFPYGLVMYIDMLSYHAGEDKIQLLYVSSSFMKQQSSGIYTVNLFS